MSGMVTSLLVLTAKAFYPLIMNFQTLSSPVPLAIKTNKWEGDNWALFQTCTQREV